MRRHVAPFSILPVLNQSRVLEQPLNCVVGKFENDAGEHTDKLMLLVGFNKSELHQNIV